MSTVVSSSAEFGRAGWLLALLRYWALIAGISFLIASKAFLRLSTSMDRPQ
jgi:hypothetical protein